MLCSGLKTNSLPEGQWFKTECTWSICGSRLENLFSTRWYSIDDFSSRIFGFWIKRRIFLWAVFFVQTTPETIFVWSRVSPAIYRSITKPQNLTKILLSGYLNSEFKHTTVHVSLEFYRIFIYTCIKHRVYSCISFLMNPQLHLSKWSRQNISITACINSYKTFQNHTSVPG